MNRERAFNRSFLLVALAAWATVLVAALPARADFIGDVFGAIDSTCDDGHGGDTTCAPQLTFKLNAFHDILKDCDGDDVDACANFVASNPEAQEAGVPSYLPKLVDIYFDVKQKDYWGLLEDGGQVAACAAAQYLTTVDVCGAIKTIIETAEAIGNDVAAAAQFLADLGEDLYNGIKDLGCDIGLWGGCDGGSPAPPPTAQELAQSFLQNSIPGGLAAMKQGWEAYLGFRNGLPAAGAQQGFNAGKISDKLDWYDDQVGLLFDSWIVQTQLGDYSKAVKAVDDPGNIQDFFQSGMQKLKNVDWDQSGFPQGSYPWSDTTKTIIEKMFKPLWAGTKDWCSSKLADANGGAIETWWSAGRPSRTGLANSTPQPPSKVCSAFESDLKTRLRGAGGLALVFHWTQGCKLNSQSNRYHCDNFLDAFRCAAAANYVGSKTFCDGGDAPFGGTSAPSGSSSSGGGGPAKTYLYLCGPKQTVTHSTSPTPPPGCTRMPQLGGPNGAAHGQMGGKGGGTPLHNNF